MSSSTCFSPPVVEEESDVLSINADTCDSDIEGPKAEEEEPNAKGPARDAPEGEGEGGSGRRRQSRGC